jgi:hypothetical protein
MSPAPVSTAWAPDRQGGGRGVRRLPVVITKP